MNIGIDIFFFFFFHFENYKSYSDIKCTDFEKPLAISAGTDSFSSIDLQFPQTRPSAMLDTIKQIYVTHIPQESRSNEIILEDPSNDPNFNEPIIDRLRTQREEVYR